MKITSGAGEQPPAIREVEQILLHGLWIWFVEDLQPVQPLRLQPIEELIEALHGARYGERVGEKDSAACGVNHGDDLRCVRRTVRPRLPGRFRLLQAPG